MGDQVAERDPALASEKRTRILPLLLVIAVAAMLVFSCTSLIYYLQAKDRRDAEYKAQYVLIQEMEFSITSIFTSVDSMMNNSYNLTQRYDFGRIAMISFDELSWSCEVLKNMYLSGSEEYLTFGELELASSSTSVVCDRMLEKIWQNITTGEPYVHNTTVATAMSNAGYLFYNTLYCIGQRFDSSKDWQRDPYSVVKGMDLEGIRTNATQIVYVTSPWISPW